MVEAASVRDLEGGCVDPPEGGQNLVAAPDVDASFLVLAHSQGDEEDVVPSSSEGASRKDDRSFHHLGGLDGDPQTKIHFPPEAEVLRSGVDARMEVDLVMVNSPHGNVGYDRGTSVAYPSHRREFPLWGEAEDAPRIRTFDCSAPCERGEARVYPNLVPSSRVILEKANHVHRLAIPERDGLRSRIQSTVYLAVDGVGVTQGCGQSPSSSRPS